ARSFRRSLRSPPCSMSAIWRQPAAIDSRRPVADPSTVVARGERLMRKRLLLLAGAALAATAAATPARAFGLRTHLYIADQVWQDLADCRVSIRGADFAIPAEACRAIRGHRGEFLAGALGPDVFPDVLVGQAIV